jgi:hypothetical protein|tara:strand:- start:896 stop:1318 length:423 start_codon:yes stop_codon:yes gene_type:complete
MELTRLTALDTLQEFSKKELKLKAKEAVTSLLDAGDTDLTRSASNIARLKEVVTELDKQLRPHLEAAEAYGVKITMKNTGDRLDYEQDDVYKSLKKELEFRKELLNMAYKTNNPIFDKDGVEIPKVGIKTHGSLVPNISF